MGTGTVGKSQKVSIGTDTTDILGQFTVGLVGDTLAYGLTQLLLPPTI